MKKKEKKLTKTKTKNIQKSNNNNNNNIEEVEKDKGGRPPLFADVAELQAKIDDFFQNCPDKRKVFSGGETQYIPAPTISGLAYFLGFESRQSFYDYEKMEKFSYVIKKARLFIEKEYEMMLQGNNVAGVIFALKNMGWKDEMRIDETSNRNVSVNISVSLEDRIAMLQSANNLKQLV